MQFIRIALLSVVFLGLGLPTGWAENKLKLPAGVEYVAAVEGITEYRLANGLSVLLFPDPSKPIITVNVTYKVGSRHEGYGETGMAHLLEHLMFKGSTNHPNIPQELSARGARPNGTTSFDRTNYYETFDATEDNLRWALSLESDRMINAFISRKDLESEFSVVRNEYESGENNPFSVLYKRLLNTMFQWHNYGNLPIGEKSDIENAPIERLQAFYRLYYQPDNAVLVITGKIDPQKTLDLVQEYFGKIPKPTRSLIPTYTREPTQDGERQVMLRRTGDVQVFGCAFRSVAGSHPDYVALAVLANLLSDEPSGRLYKALVETKKAASISGYAAGYAEAGFVSFWAEVRKEQSIQEVQQITLAVLEELNTKPPTAEEVEKARTRLLKSFEMAFKESSHVGLALSNYIGLGDWRLAFLYRDQLEKITPAQVAQAGRDYFKPANRTLGFFLPEPTPDRAVIPEAPELTVLLKDYKGKPAIAQGEDFDPSPANIEQRTTRATLPNGMKIALLPKQTRGDVVQATVTLRLGTLAALQGQQTVGALTAALLDKGTATKDRQQIKELLDKLKARLSISGGPSSVTVNIATEHQYLAEVIALAGEILRQPAFPATELEKLRTEELAGLEQQRTDPSYLAQLTFSRLTSPYPTTDPRYTMTPDEALAAIKAVSLDQIQAFHAKFYGASAATAAIVGDFDPEQIRAALATAFGDWKNPTPFERIASPHRPFAPTQQTILTPDKANAIFIAGLGYPMRNDHPDYPALIVGGWSLGGGFLNSRLATRIRQQEGLSYSVGGRFFADAFDENGGFQASAIHNPKDAAKLAAVFQEEIQRAAKDGLTAAEFEAARSGWLKARKVQRSNDNYLTSILSSYLQLERTLAWDAALEAQVEKLTLAEVNAALNRYLDHAKMTTVTAGDLKKDCE